MACNGKKDTIPGTTQSFREYRKQIEFVCGEKLFGRQTVQACDCDSISSKFQTVAGCASTCRTGSAVSASAHPSVARIRYRCRTVSCRVREIPGVLGLHRRDDEEGSRAESPSGEILSVIARRRNSKEIGPILLG